MRWFVAGSFLLFLLAALGACRQQAGEVATRDPSPFKVVSLSPTDGDLGVAVNRPLQATFNQPVSLESITANTQPGPCQGSWQLSRDQFATCVAFTPTPQASEQGRVITLTPVQALLAGASYRLRLTSAIFDVLGNPLLIPYTMTTGFKVSENLTLVSITPAKGQTGVGVAGPLTLVFSEVMDPASLTLGPGNGNCTEFFQISTDQFIHCHPLDNLQPSLDGVTFGFTPNFPLADEAYYQVRVGPPAASQAGQVMTIEATSDFRTAKIWPGLIEHGGPGAESGVVLLSQGRLFALGETNGSLDGVPALGGKDVYNIQFNLDGTRNWTTLEGSAVNEQIRFARSDPFSGDLLILGSTDGASFGQVYNGGLSDIFVLSKDAQGTTRFARLYGDASADYGTAGVADALGNLHLLGYSDGALGGANLGGFDLLLIHTDQGGVNFTAQRFGTASDDQGYSLALLPNGEYLLGGMTMGAWPASTQLGLGDAFWIKVNGAGSLLGSFQWGSGNQDEVVKLLIDNQGNLYAVGNTFAGTSALLFDGQPTYGGQDIFITKFDSQGVKLWTKLYGGPGDQKVNGANGAVIDSAGDIYLAGSTTAAFDGEVFAGGIEDALIMKINPAGNRLWTRVRGTAAQDSFVGVSLDDYDRVFVGGYTLGAFPGRVNQGQSDLLVIQFLPDGTER